MTSLDPMTSLDDLYGQAVPVAALADLDRAAWLEHRLAGIGGSDAAAILGLSPFATALDVWLDKTGRTASWDGNEATRWGTRLEDAVADGFAEDTDTVLHRAEHLLRHPDVPYLLANPDRFAIDPTRPGIGVYEGKTTGERNAAHWSGDVDTGDVPDHYAIQAAHYCLVTGHWWAVVACLIGGQQLRWRYVEADPALEAVMLDACAEFWWHVETDTPPPVNGPADRASESLAAAYRTVDPDLVVPVDDLADVLDELDSVKQVAATVADRQTTLENQLREALGHATVGTIAGASAVTWKPQDRTGIDGKALAAAVGLDQAAVDAYVAGLGRSEVARQLTGHGRPLTGDDLTDRRTLADHLAYRTRSTYRVLRLRKARP